MLKGIGRKVRKQFTKDYLVFPALAGPFFAPVLLGNLTANLVRNVWSHAIIFCGHFPDGAVQFEEEQLEGETRGQWYVRQMMGSANLDGGPLFHLMTGNLSFQVEHHLFPDLPSNRYAELSVEVRALCEEFGMDYTTGPLWPPVPAGRCAASTGWPCRDPRPGRHRRAVGGAGGDQPAARPGAGRAAGDQRAAAGARGQRARAASTTSSTRCSRRPRTDPYGGRRPPAAGGRMQATPVGGMTGRRAAVGGAQAPLGSRLLGRDLGHAAARRVRVQSLLTASLVVANVVGAGVVGVLLVAVIPGPSLFTAEQLLVNAVAVPLYLSAALLVGVVGGTLLALRALRWAVEGREPTAADQVATLAVPWRLTLHAGGALGGRGLVLLTTLYGLSDRRSRWPASASPRCSGRARRVRQRLPAHRVRAAARRGAGPGRRRARAAALHGRRPAARCSPGRSARACPWRG